MRSNQFQLEFLKADRKSSREKVGTIDKDEGNSMSVTEHSFIVLDLPTDMPIGVYLH